MSPISKAKRAAMFERVIDALIDAEYPDVEKRLEEAQSAENIEAFERWSLLEDARRKYADALKAKDLDAMTAITADADLRRDVLSELIRTKGRPVGAGDALARHYAQQARHLKKRLRTIWPRLEINDLPRYGQGIADEIIESFFSDRLKMPLPPGWQKQH